MWIDTIDTIKPANYGASMDWLVTTFGSRHPSRLQNFRSLSATSLTHDIPTIP